MLPASKKRTLPIGPSTSTGCGPEFPAAGTARRERSQPSSRVVRRLRMVRNLLLSSVMFAHVLVPIDLSDRNTRVLRIVETLPAKRVTLLHVIHQVRGLPAAELRPFYERLRRRAQRVVQRAAATLSASGLRVQHAVT